MSPALLNKYLQAAREVADHMVLKPDGFDFSPHPMLVETDREKYAIKRIVDFYERQPTDYADYFQAAWRFKHRAALGKAERHAGRHRGGSEGERQVSAHGLADPRGIAGRGRTRSGRSPNFRPCGARCPAPGARPAGCAAREMCRDARLRGQDPEAHGDGVRRSGGEGIERLLAAPDQLEVPPVQLAPQGFRSQRSADGERPAAGGSRDPEVSRARSRNRRSGQPR